MKLYHGTTEFFARKAMREGLKPRGTTGKSHWKHTVQSRRDAVYLTDIYAGYFGLHITKKGERIAIIEVETDLLNPILLQPDEDFLEQASRGHDDVQGDMKKRTAHYKKVAYEYVGKWVLSVQHLGTAAYAGVIPPEAMTRVTFWRWDTNSAVAGALIDPSITLLNHQIMKGKYEALTRWLFGGKITPEEYVGFGDAFPIEGKQRKSLEECLKKQDVEVFAIRE